MPSDFDHIALAQRIRFGTGKAPEILAEEVKERQAQRIMLIASEFEQEIALKVTALIQVLVNHQDVAPHVPIDKALIAREIAVANQIDLIVCVGGGSTTGLAKAIALTTGISIVAVPTTYAGSEATNVWGLTEESRKTTGIDNAVLPATIIYDANLTLSLPIDLSIASGMNGMAHCVDSMWAPRTDPLARSLAEEGIRSLAKGLRGISRDGLDIDSREWALLGAYASASSFSSAGSGLHHKICHVLGGRFNLPHAQTHTVILPHVLAFNVAASAEADERIARALDAPSALVGLDQLYNELDAPRALQDFGFASENIPESVELIMEVVPTSNPRPVSSSDLTLILENALVGNSPLSR
jgi:maleylacetate reductase